MLVELDRLNDGLISYQVGELVVSQSERQVPVVVNANDAIRQQKQHQSNSILSWKVGFLVNQL